ncbi:hypothetical protein [Coraliomargarita parva]|uniref:hypothetical protein n=1 Tax=Coraliomargarita parva TaxID=3014050 RepID=UPI0022B3C9B7|nr:hypothetical protein [Coraliomargarita parva]
MKDLIKPEYAPENVLEWMPCLKLEDNWTEGLPEQLRKAVLPITESTGESIECVMATVLPILSAILRRRLMIHDQRGQAVCADISSILIRPDGQPRIKWHDTLCRMMLLKEALEEGMLESFESGDVYNHEGINYIARETVVFPELNTMAIERKMQSGKLRSVFLHSLSTSLVDQLNRLTKPSKQDLVISLQEGWDNDYFVSKYKGHSGGINLHWSIDKDEVDMVYRSLYGNHQATPVLMLLSKSEFKGPDCKSLKECVALCAKPWEYSQQHIQHVSFTKEDEALINKIIESFETELMSVPNALAQRHLTILPGLFHKCLLLFKLYEDVLEVKPMEYQEAESVVLAAANMSRALVSAHYSTLHKITGGFTVEPLPTPDDPEETIREYRLLAKIARIEPVNRGTLNRNHSNQQRELLSDRLARLLREGKVVIDERGYYSIGDAMSF